MKQNKWWFIAAAFGAILFFAWKLIMTDTSDALTGKEVYAVIDGRASYLIFRIVAALIIIAAGWFLFYTERGQLSLETGATGMAVVIIVFIINAVAWFGPVANVKADPISGGISTEQIDKIKAKRK